jgi:hypothetical protein
MRKTDNSKVEVVSFVIKCRKFIIAVKLRKMSKNEAGETVSVVFLISSSFSIY